MADPEHSISARMAKLNPFAGGKSSKRAASPNSEDRGQATNNDTIAGGGRSARRTAHPKGQLRISQALKSFLVCRAGILSEQQAGLDDCMHPQHMTRELQDLLELAYLKVPEHLTDRRHPLAEYFISSSHNTYLLGRQLTGKSSAEAYTTTLRTGARCVEIDAWDDEAEKEEPKVTHGYTLVSNIPFRTVCEAIRDAVDLEVAEAAQNGNPSDSRPAPVMISLENHCDAYGQMRMVQIMRETLGDRLLSKPVREKGHREQEGSGEKVFLEDLGSKVVLIVEFHLPEEDGKSSDPKSRRSSSSSSSSSSSNDDEEVVKQARRAYRARQKTSPKGNIIPELAELGVYAQSVKPTDSTWYEDLEMKNGPHNHLINLSETQLASLMPAQNKKIAQHNSRHLMRVYPKGTRISSQNLNPIPFWGVGAQICALNWQTFGASVQLNEALFSGTDGIVLKPSALRGGTSLEAMNGGRRRRRKLQLHIGGATDLPISEERDLDSLRPYVTCTLLHPDGGAVKRKTSPYHHHTLDFLHRHCKNPPNTDPVWDQTLKWDWEYQSGSSGNDLTFLRILIKSDDTFAENPILAVTAVRLLYVVAGNWCFVRLLDLKGRETGCTLLVKFEIVDEDVEDSSGG